MPRTRAEAAKKMNEVAKVFAQYAKRDLSGKHSLYDSGQKQERMMNFLDIHVDIYDDYISFFDENPLGNREEDRIEDHRGDPMSDLSRDAKTLAETMYRYKTAIENNAPNTIRIGSGEQKGVQGRVLRNYNRRQNNLSIEEEEVSLNELLNGNDREKKKDSKAAGALPKNGTLVGKGGRDIRDEQMSKVREIFAWMYRTTKTHQRFIDGIAQRSPREKLLICYIVEENKRHSLSQKDINKLVLYIPDPQKFENNMKYSKHWYKLGVKDNNWGLVTDAANMAFRLRESLTDIDFNNLASAMERSPSIGPEDNIFEMDNEIQGNLEHDREELFGRSMVLDSLGMRMENVHIRALNIARQIQGVEGGKQNKESGDAQLKKIFQDVDSLSESLGELESVLGNKDIEKKVTQELMGAQQGDKAKNRKVDKKVFEKLKGGPPGAAMNIAALNTEIQYRTKYVGTLRQVVAIGTGFLKDYKTDIDNINKPKAGKEVLTKGTKSLMEHIGLEAQSDKIPDNTADKEKYFKHFEIYQKAGNWASFGLDSLMSLFNFVNVFAQFSGLCKSFSSTSWRDLIPKLGDFVNAVGGAGKSGIAAATTGGSLIGNVSWGSAGTSAVAKGLKSATGYLGVITGGLTAGIGAYNLVNSTVRRSELTSLERSIDNTREREAANGQESKETRAKKQGEYEIVKNVIASNRNALKRTQATSAVQTVQGGLTMAAGILNLATVPTLGLSGIISLGLSGVAMLLGIYNTILKKKSKAAEVADVIDKYIGMDDIYERYVDQNYPNDPMKPDRARWVKKQGGEKALRSYVRSEVRNLLGYHSDKKMYADIMYQYAETLYRLAFFKDNGELVSFRGDVQAADGTVLNRNKYNYGKMLQNLGFDLKYSKNGKNPSPSVNEIFKKLTS